MIKWIKERLFKPKEVEEEDYMTCDICGNPWKEHEFEEDLHLLNTYSKEYDDLLEKSDLKNAIIASVRIHNRCEEIMRDIAPKQKVIVVCDTCLGQIVEHVTKEYVKEK